MATQHPTSPKTRFPALTSLILVPIALLFALAGCLSRPALVHQTFALQSPPTAGAAAAKGDRVLALRKVEVSPLFQSRSLAYRTGPDAYELDAYASFIVPPNRALAIPVCAYLRNAGAFKNVLEPGSPLAADTLLDVQVSELYGDFRQHDKPAAVLSLRLLFYRSGTGGASEVLLQKDYSRSIPLEQKTAAAVVACWDKALAEIMTEAANDLAAAK